MSEERFFSISRRRFFRRSFMSGLLLSDMAVARSTAKDLDVLVIGSGPAGLSVADRLSASGVNVLVVESGQTRPTSRYQTLNEVTGDRDLAPYGLGVAGRRAVGGTTHAWGGLTPRLRECDFNTKRDYDYGLDWPISFSEMSHYYCEAGAWLQNRDSLCKRDVESPFVASSGLLIDELKALKITQALPASMSATQSGRLKPINLARSVVPCLVRRQRFSLLKNTTVRRLEINERGAITGAVCVDRKGVSHLIKADKVVLAGGAIQNARLLLLSKNTHFPDGIGNAYGNVGAYFMDHPNMQFWVEPNKELLLPSHKNTYVNSYHYYEPMKKLGMGSALMRFVCFNQAEQHREGFKLYPESDGFAKPGQRLMVGALCEQEPRRRNRISLDRQKTDFFGDPLAHLSFEQSNRDVQTIDYSRSRIRALIEQLGGDYSVRPLRLSSNHLMGTTRMSSSDKTGVVDENQKVFGSTNLYLAGSSVFSTGGAASPTLTLTALSLRLADHLLSGA